MLTMVDIKAVVGTAKDFGNNLIVEGYKSQDGGVSTFEVSFLGDDGYDDLVSKSASLLRKKIESGDLFPEHFDIPEGEVTPDDLYAWAAEQLHAWNTRLSTPVQMRHNRSLSDGLVQHEDGWFFKQGGEDVVILLNMTRENKEVLREPTKGPKSWGKSRVKKAIVESLPLGGYIGRLNLTPENIDGLRLVTG